VFNKPSPFAPLQKVIGVKFKNHAFLERVFVHRSYLNEAKGSELESNERMEFLGDAVLELVVTDHLYRNYPNAEGDLTNWRSALVKGEHLAKIAHGLNLHDYLQLSRGEEQSGGRKKHYLLANTMEALIGAIYLDRGYKVTAKFIEQFILVHLKEILEKGLHIDAKSHLQEISQGKFSTTPIYRVLKSVGPDHAKTFTIGVYLKEELVGIGVGTSKQAGEQTAARAALTNKGWS
jgi:ribonuclease-3